MSRTTTIGLALLLVGVVSGAAGANAIKRLDATRLFGSGLFTVEPNETVHFNVSLQAGRGEPPARILLNLLDTNGIVVARRDVTLEPGRSATLRYSLPGVLRAQAEILDPDTTLGGPRSVLSTIEIFGSGDPRALDLDLKSRRRFVCSSDDPAGPGRIPDQD